MNWSLTAMATDPTLIDTVVGWFKDPETLLVAMGPWVLWGTLAIVFVESGVLFPVLPGDSLLFTAGLLHDRLHLHLPTLVLLTFIAAFLGAQIGYFLGAQYGRRFFSPNARFLKTEYLEKAEHYFDHYGGRSLVIGRFIPFVRTFIPLAAGIARYPYGKFLLYNSVGSLLWGVGITYLGSVLGGIQFVHDHLSLIVMAIVVVSVMPMIIEVLLRKRAAATAGRVDTADIDAVPEIIDSASLIADTACVETGDEATARQEEK
ncbi:DedA family protein [Schaalia sp. ZJ1691]|uniref:VTT domain-containing protein n=1 Tax=Schaalia sp. ZJ1691 TaxID=2709404 RepID=UPI0013EBCB56